MSNKKVVKLWTTYLQHYDDFPIPNVRFYDIFSVLANKIAFKDLMIDVLTFIPQDIDFVIGIDSRGFLFGPLLAYQANAGFIPIRKMMKLPGAVYSQKYALEYSDGVLEIQKNAFANLPKKQGGINVVIVDDLIATGGSLDASIKILRNFAPQIKINIINIIAILEIEKLEGRKLVENKGLKFTSLLKI